jgi:BirA family biotin operon repressor/biotin-[acetyl-CoA-carboxylase] ligase
MEDQLKNGHVFGSRQIVVADYQTAGKGNGNNNWESERGKNLTFSVFYDVVNLKAYQQFYLNMAVSLAVCDFVGSQITDAEVSIKWPNDIYIDDRKVGGMLIKHTVSGNQLLYSIIGIGLNINQEQFISDAPNPVSMIHYVHDPLDLNICMDGLCLNLDSRFDQLESGKLNFIKSDYLANLFAFRNYRKYLLENKLIKARITGVSEYGSLQLEGENGESLECDFKEIRFVL